MLLSQETLAYLSVLYQLPPLRQVGSLGGLSSENIHLRSLTRDYVLKVYPESYPQEQIHIALNVARKLHELNFPIAVPLITSTGSALSQLPGNKCFFILVNKIPGRILYAPFAPLWLRAIAQLLARFHRSAQPFATMALQSGVVHSLHDSPYERLPDSVRVSLALKKELLDRWSGLGKQAPAQELIHGDFHNGNLLFDTRDCAITGLLDFEYTRYGCGVMDVVYFIHFSLFGQEINQVAITSARQFIDEYRKECPLSRDQFRIGFAAHLCLMAGSTFFEQRFLETQEAVFQTLMLRDTALLRTLHDEFDWLIAQLF